MVAFVAWEARAAAAACFMLFIFPSRWAAAFLAGLPRALTLLTFFRGWTSGCEY